MPFVHKAEDGTETTYATPEEVAVKDAEIARLAALDAERGQNFSKFNEKTAALEGKLTDVEKKLAEKELAEKNYARESSFAKYGNSEEVKKALEEGYAKLAGMPETTPSEIQARTETAARIAGFSLNSMANPLYVNPSGEAPKMKQADPNKEFEESDRGKAALSAMGIAPEPEEKK